MEFPLFLATAAPVVLVDALVLPSSSNRCGTTALHSEPFHSWGPSLPQPTSPPTISTKSADPNRPAPAETPQYQYAEPPMVDLNGQVRSRESNLSHPRRSVNEDPRPFDMDRRFSQRPDSYSNEARRAWWDTAPSDRVQGGSRRTYNAPYDRDMSHVFLETDGRPLDAEFEVWDGPNNTPTKMKVYSEDGRLRPINAFVENPQKGIRGETLSVRNVAPMEFPINAGVGNVGGGLAGNESPFINENDLRGFRRPTPSTKRGEIVQGGALKTFPLDYSVEAAQVTITTEGLPMNAKVELWGTSSHIKQVAEIYNDDGRRRPFAAIIDVPGGSNTIAVYNEGPLEYPIRVVVEPVARIDGWDGKEQKFGGSLAPW